MFYIIQNFDTKEYIKGKNKFTKNTNIEYFLNTTNTKEFKNIIVNVTKLKTKLFFSQYDANRYIKKHNYNIPNYYIKVMYNKDIEKLI